MTTPDPNLAAAPAAPAEPPTPAIPGAVSGPSTEHQQPGIPEPAPVAEPGTPEPGTPQPPRTPAAAAGAEESKKVQERIVRAKNLELARVLKKLGVKTVEQAQAQLKAGANARAAGEKTRLARMSEQEKLRERLNKAEVRAKAAEARIVQLETVREHSKIEAEMQRATIAAGVRPDEVDYALHQLSRHIQSLSNEDMASFDPNEWLVGDLKRRKPHIFTDSAVNGAPPATTGLGGGDGGGAPPPSTSPASQEGPDVFKMSKGAWLKHLRDKGMGV